MNLNTQKKLISTSKTMLLILRILFVILILMALIPWIAPNSSMGSFLMSMFDVQQFLNRFGDTTLINGSSYNFNLLSRIIGFIGSIISLLPLLIGTIIMMQLSKNYATGDVFTSKNAKSYSILGIIYLLSALLLNPLSKILFSLCVSINNPVGHRFISFSIDVSNLMAIFFAILLITIGRVMQLAQKINDDQEFML